MPQTIGGEVRQIIVDDGVVSGRIFNDRAPANATLPYVVITDAIDLFPILKGDAATIRLERQMQVSVFQDEKDRDRSIPARVYSLLDGARLTLGGGQKVRVSVLSMPRIYEESTNIVHRPLTLSVKHEPTAY
jgi:hypothetical protein